MGCCLGRDLESPAHLTFFFSGSLVVASSLTRYKSRTTTFVGDGAGRRVDIGSVDLGINLLRTGVCCYMGLFDRRHDHLLLGFSVACWAAGVLWCSQCIIPSLFKQQSLPWPDH